MKRLLLLGMLCLFGAFAHGQITRIEYFVDNDPGHGKAISVPLNADTDGYVNFNVPLQTVPEGFHSLFVRTKGSDGKWSHTDRRIFFVRKGQATPSITKIRYSFKGDGAPDKVYEHIVTDPKALIDISFFATLADLTPKKTYKIYLQAVDENGFVSRRDSAEFFVRPPILIEKVEVTNLACFGVNSGKSIINASGEGMTLEYSIDDKTFLAGNTFENLAPGDYVAYVRDKDDPANKVQSTFVITSPTEVSVAFSLIVTPTCAENSDGSVTVNATGGTAPYTYKLATQTSFQASNIITGLPVGEAEIVVKDANGCEKTGKVTIAPPSPITVSFSSPVSPTCAGNADGSITVNATGGTAPYTYKLASQSAFQTSNIITGLSVGEAEIVVKDANGCEKTGKVTIAPPAEIVVSFTSLVQPDCPADASGGFTVAASGGAGGYEYKLSTQATFQTAALFKDLPAGTYTVTVKDKNGCEKTGNVEIVAKSTNPPIPTITVQGRDGIDATVSLQSSTATGNQWLLNGSEIPGATSQTLPITQPGNYQVRVTNAGGCQSVSTSTVITSNPEIRTLNTKTYPNPTDGVVIIDLGKEVQIDRVTVVSTTGIVMQVNGERMLTDKITLDFGPYHSGMYVVQVEGLGIFERIKIQRK